MANKTPSEIKQIAKDVQEAYSEDNLTKNGHISYVRFTVNDVLYSWKVGKPLTVEPQRYIKLNVNNLTKETLQNLIDELETMKALSEILSPPTEKKEKKKKGLNY